MRALLRRLNDKRGQAITEVALITPLALLLVLGGYDVSVMASDKVLATSAVRHGTRLGSEIGGFGVVNGSPACNGAMANGTNTPANFLAADRQVISTVLAATANMTYLGTGSPLSKLPDEIIIYNPADPGGVFNSGTDPYERYLPADNFATNKHVSPYASGDFGMQFTLDKRCQGPLGSESEIGVQMKWTYKPANGIPGPQLSFTDYAVEKIMLCSENCIR